MRVELVGTVTVSAGGPDPELSGPAPTGQALTGQALTGQALGGRRARVALAALALADGAVPAERLALLVWDGEPPPSWQPALRGIIRALRTAAATLGADGRELVVTTPSGYRLGPTVVVDVAAADGTLRAAAVLLERDPLAALAAAESVSRLSGAALLPGEDGEWLRPHRIALDDLRRRALDLSATAATTLGDHPRALAAARAAVVADPLDERAHRRLIWSLHAAGDRAGAIRAYETCRATLADNLGIDPSAETVEAYLAVLDAGGGPEPARLPVVRSAFLGRAADTEALSAALRRPGLVTVVGRGGVGKSRLAVHAAGLATGFGGGRLWVDLGAATPGRRGSDLVASTVAGRLRCRVGSTDPVLAVGRHLAPRGRTLLVLDGCEAVLDGVASLVAALRTAAPALTVLATSRVRLDVEGERVHVLAPLPMPAAADPAGLADSVAVRLLAGRARAAGGSLSIRGDNAALVAALAARCGGLPLALELAGSQLAVMSVADLVEHLDSGAGPDPGGELVAVLRRSYELLDPDEAAVFRRLAVLDGPVGLPLIRSVVSDRQVTPVRVIRLLRELTDRSLLEVEASGPRWSYQQDDDVRRFATVMLDEHGETAATVGRLADAVRALLPDDVAAPPDAFADTITEVAGTVRALLAAALDGRLDRDRGLEIATRLHRYWAATDVAEGRFWLGRLLDTPTQHPWTPMASFCAGYLAYWAGDSAAAIRELTGAVDLLEHHDDSFAARALLYLGGLADDIDDADGAVTAMNRSIAAADRAGDPGVRIAAVLGLAGLLSERGDPGTLAVAEEAVALARELAPNGDRLAMALPTAAMACWQVGDLGRASELLAEAEGLLGGGPRISRVVLGSVSTALALAAGEPARAARLAAVAVAEGSRLGIDRELPLIHTLYARALLALGDLAGAADQARAGLRAAGALDYDWPLATVLETTALVAAARSGPSSGVDDLLVTAVELRQRGRRVVPVPLAAPVAALRNRLGDPSAPPSPPDRRPAVDRALELLERLER